MHVNVIHYISIYVLLQKQKRILTKSSVEGRKVLCIRFGDFPEELGLSFSGQANKGWKGKHQAIISRRSKEKYHCIFRLYF